MTIQPVAPIVATPAPVRRSIARSHVGRVRAINEDRLFDDPAAGLWAVADGMGGHAGGDLAAQAVIDRLRDLAAAGHALAFADLLSALHRANADIRQRNADAGVDAGATVVALLRVDAGAHIAWAGDSRAYRLRDGTLEQLTHDHSVVQELVDAGLLTPDQAERHPQANVVTRALGVSDDPGLQTSFVELRPGDALLLCSDGLSRSLRDDDCWVGAIEPLADRMLGAALSRDGTDNISLVLIAADDCRDSAAT